MNYLLFALSCISLFMISLLINSKENNIRPLELLVRSISIYLLSVCLLSIIFLLVGHYNIFFIISALAAILIILLILRIKEWKHAFRFSHATSEIKLFPAILLFLVLMFPILKERMEFVDMTGDAGVYSISAIHYLKEGKLKDELELRNQLSEESRDIYDRDNLLWVDKSSNRGAFLPGTYFDPKHDSTYYFQFYPAWPLIMSFWAGIFGVNQLTGVMILLYYMILLLSFYLLINLGLKQCYAALGVLLLGSAPLLVYFTKYPTSELFLLFLFVLTLYMLSTRSTFGCVTAGLTVTLFCLAHISSFMYVPLLFLALVFGYKLKDRSLLIFSAIGFAGFLISIPYGWKVSLSYFIDIYTSNFSAIFGDRYAMSLGLLSTLLMGAIGLVCSLILFRKTLRV